MDGIGSVSDFILSAKDAVDLAVANIQQAALPWAGVCIGLEILARPAEATKSNVAGIAHVTSKMDWYCALSEHLLDANDTIDNTDFTSIRQRLEKRVVSLYEALLLYQMKTICSYYRHQGLVFLRALASLDDWDGDLASVKSAEADVETEASQFYQENTKSALSVLANTANDMVTRLGDLTQTVQDFVDSQKEAEMDAAETACRRDLYLVDPHHDMMRIEGNKDKLFDGAYEWILDTKEYKDFTNWDDYESTSSSRLLWINGLAGTGKTMLMIGIICKLSSQKAARAPRLSFFFCQGTNDALKTPTAVLRSLIWLLLVQEPVLISHLLQKHKERPGLFTDENSFVALSEAFENMLRDSRLPHTYLAVDALDELDEGEDKLRLRLIELIVQSLTYSKKIRWLVSSRPEAVPESLIRPDAFVELNTDNLKQPVAAYIQHKASSLVGKNGYDNDIIEKIKQEISERANDTFLWAALVFKALDQVKGWDAVDTVKEMPAQLSRLYGHMLDKIWKHHVKDQERCRNVLIACFLAKRPLTLDELPIVADLFDGQPARVSSMEILVRDIITKCSSFLGIADRTINLVHQSAWDYLNKNYTSKLQPDSDGVAKGHLEISRRSIRAMMLLLQRNPWKLPNDFKLTEDSRSDRELLPSNDPLAPIRYSCVYWATHLCSQECRNSNEAELADDGPVHQFLKARILRWLESLILLGKFPEGLHTIRNILNIALSRPGSFPHLISFLKDAEKFFLIHAEMINRMPVQIYLSALIFSPTKSLVRTCQWKERLVTVVPVTGIEDLWPPYIYLQDFGDIIDDISLTNKLLVEALRGSFSGSISIWDLPTGLLLQNFHCDHRIKESAILPDGKEMAVVTDKKQLFLLSLATGIFSRVPLDLDITNHTKTSLSPNGEFFVSFGSTIHIFNTKTGVSLQTLENERYVDSMKFSPDGTMLAIVSTIDLETYSDSDSDSDSDAILDSDLHATITLWDVKSGKRRQMFPCLIPRIRMENGTRLIISPDGKLLACACTADDVLIQIWDTMTGTRRYDLKYPGRLKIVTFSPDGKTLVAVSKNKEREFFLLWDLAVDIINPQVAFESKYTAVLNLIFSPDNRFFLIHGGGFTIEVLNVADIAHGMSARLNQKEEVIYVGFSSDAALLASVSDNTLWLWDANTGECLRTWDVPGIYHSVFSPDSTTIAACFTDKGKDKIGLWNAATGTCQRTWEVQGNVSAMFKGKLVYSPSGKLLAFIYMNDLSLRGQDPFGIYYTAQLWNLDTGVCQRMWENLRHNYFAFSPDEKLVALFEEDAISLWDIGTSKCLHTWKCDEVTTLLFSPDGTTLAAGTRGDSKSVRFWDVTTGEQVLVIHADQYPEDIEFGKDFRVNGKVVESPFRFPASKDSDVLKIEGHYVFQNNVPLLYIPNRYNSYATTVCGDKIALTPRDGDLVILKVEES